MSIVNFAISKPLEKQINNTIEEYGFNSKAEFFRFLAINFVYKKKNLLFENDSEISSLTNQIIEATQKKDFIKKMPSIREQLKGL